MMKSGLSKSFLLIVLLTAFLGRAQQVDHVILVSIDGFRPEFYRQQKWSTPNIKMLAENGVSADEVRTIFPSVTYPSHTTLSTGVLPERHGIYYNTHIKDDGSPGGWIYDFNDIKAPTIWEAVKSKGLVTASVSWPVTVNNPYIDYNIPEIWSFTDPLDRRGATANYARPKGLFEEVVEHATGAMDKDEYNLTSLRMDQNLGRMASYILETYKPNFLSLHLPNLDGAQHASGREGTQVARAMSGADHVIGEIYDAVKRAGIGEKTAIIVTGDHGFVSVHTSITPNIWLKDLGLEDKAFFFSTGGSAFLHVLEGNKEQIVKKVKEGLKKLPLAQQSMFRIVEKTEMQAVQSDPRVSLAISAMRGFSFSNERDGVLLTRKRGGKHGYFPDFHEIYTGFVAYGPGLAKGEQVQRIALEDIAVICADLLGIELPEATGASYPGMFKE